MISISWLLCLTLKSAKHGGMVVLRGRYADLAEKRHVICRVKSFSSSGGLVQ